LAAYPSTFERIPLSSPKIGSQSTSTTFCWEKVKDEPSVFGSTAFALAISIYPCFLFEYPIYAQERLKEKFIQRSPSLKPDWPLALTLSKFQILRPVSITRAFKTIAGIEARLA
jgi:hypothetical protein